MAATPSVVSLWRERERKGLLCSGLLLDSRHILTVKHAFDGRADGQPVFVRLIDGKEGDVEARLLQCHGTHDAAILQLITAVRAPPPPRLCDTSNESLMGRAATLHVVDPDNHSRASPSSFSIANFDDVTGEHVIIPENARGHSGGVVEVGGEIIGLLSRRKTSDPLCRAVAMHLLWSWIRDTLASLPTASAGSSQIVPRAVSAAYLGLLETVQGKIRKRLKQPYLQCLANHWGGDPLAGFDPTDPRGGLDVLLDGLYLATKAAIPQWRSGSTQAVADVKKGCRALLSHLVKLAVDPAAEGVERDLAVVAAGTPEQLHLACRFAGTAEVVYVALGNLSNLLTRRSDEFDITTDEAVHLNELLPVGQGEDLRQALLRKLWERVMVGEGPVPSRIDTDLERVLLGRIRRHSTRDERRYLFTAPGPRSLLSDSDYSRWAQSLHLGLVLHDAGQCSYLLMDESVLIDAVREYLGLLETL